MFAVALTPANGLTVFHTHDDHDDDHDHAEQPVRVVTAGEVCDVSGTHHEEGLHAHRIGWEQMQRAATGREIGAPVLVVQNGLAALSWKLPTQRLVRRPRPSTESEMVHAPPPLARSMALLI
jgi:hypothetical protein